MTTAQIERINTAVPFALNGDEDYGGISHVMLNWMASDSIVPPYWSRYRDQWLRRFFWDNTALKTAGATFINKTVTIPFSITALDPSIDRHVEQSKMLEKNLFRYSGSMSSTPGKGFKEFLKMFIMDYLCQDNGAFGLVMGPGPADGPIVGAPVGLLHLDSSRCTRTKNPEYPVKYYHTDGREYRIHYARVIEMVNLPSSNEELNGVGMCAVSCCVDPAQELWDIYRYNAEKFGSRPPRQILYAETGATHRNLEDAVNAWKVKMDNQGRERFGGTLIAAPNRATQTLKLHILDLNSAPDNFDRRDTTTINKSEIAAAFGLDLRDMSYSLGTPGQTRADAEVQDRKGRGKGPGEFLETFAAKFCLVYLNDEIHTADFDYMDDEQDEQRASIRETRSMARERDLRAAVTTIRVEREKMWHGGEITQEQFEDMELVDGRLPNGLDVLLLFHSQDSDFQTWLETGVENPTEVSKNDPEMMVDILFDRIAEVSEIVNTAQTSRRARKARQALAALETLRSMYQMPDDTMIDEGQALEAMDEGADEMGEPPPEPEDDEVLEKQINLTDEAIQAILSDYEERFENVMVLARNGEISRVRLEEVLRDLVASIILALFLRGSRVQQIELSRGENSLIQQIIDEHFRSLQQFIGDIYDGRYADDALGIDGIITRIERWVNIAAGAFFLGLIHRRDNPRLKWVWNPIKEHCEDCRRLNEQVHTAQEWLASEWWPRSFRLACTGQYCGCTLIETDDPLRGNF